MEYCYAVCFSNGIIKFGRTCDLHARILSHVTSAAAHSITCMCALVSGSSDSFEDEKAMIAKAKLFLEQQEQGSEYFKGTAEDALDVMTRAGLLPIPTYPDKESQGGGIRFVVARVGTDFSGYKIVRLANTKPKSVISVLRKTPLGEGVIKNKMRGVPPEEVLAQLDALVKEGTVLMETKRHKRNGRTSLHYRLK